MTEFKNLRIWLWRLSVGTALVTLLLSWQAGVSKGLLLTRALVSGGLIYLLTSGSLVLFSKMTPKTKENEANLHIDVAVGLEDNSQEDNFNIASAVTEKINAQDTDFYQAEKSFPGQVNPNLSEGLNDGEHQAEIVRRMGWGEQGEQGK